MTNLSTLTRREKEIARELYLTPKILKQIAFDLGMSKGTATVHQIRVYKKLGVDSRPGLMLLAVRSGWLTAEICAASDAAHVAVRAKGVRS